MERAILPLNLSTVVVRPCPRCRPEDDHVLSRRQHRKPTHRLLVVGPRGCVAWHQDGRHRCVHQCVCMLLYVSPKQVNSLLARRRLANHVFIVDDMGETKDLSQAMPEKTADMIRKLDAYLEKVGAWTMEEVYETRMEELEHWVARGQKEVSQIQQKLEASNLSPAETKQLQAQLKSRQATLKRHSTTLEKQPSIEASDRWM